jgi:rhodanese-related sulfurtransferase
MIQSARIRRLSSLLAGAAALSLTIVAFATEQLPSTPADQPQAADGPGAPAVEPITQDQLTQRIAAGDPTLFLLDVRSPGEFSAGHISGAVNIPYDQVATRLADVPQDKDVALYCQSGRRAGLAAEVLAANGYRRLEHLEGDIKAWIEQGRPLQVSGDAKPAQ